MHESNARDWPAPDDSLAGLAPLEDFPSQRLPQSLQEWVEGEANETQTPIALPALISLACVGSAIAKRVGVRARDNWLEPTNLYCCVAMPPASRKSQVFRDATKPISEYETFLVKLQRPDVAKARSARNILEARRRHLEAVAGKGGKGAADAENEAAELAVRLASEPERFEPCLMVDDCTSEALVVGLSRQGGRLLVASAEGNVFDAMRGRYSKNGLDFDVYLKAHVGDSIRVNRIGRESVALEKPLLSLALCVQPSVLIELADERAFSDRGLTPRFLWALPESNLGRRQIHPHPMRPEVRRVYHRRMKELLQIEGQYELRLSNEASAEFDTFYEKIEEQLAPGGRLDAIQFWGGKACGMALRLAGILHCWKHGPEDEIGPEEIEAACAIVEWGVPHAERALLSSATVAPEIADALRILRWLRASAKLSFSKREAMTAMRSRFARAEALDEPLRVLVEHCFIRPVKREKAPGRASETYDVNPAAHRRGGGR